MSFEQLSRCFFTSLVYRIATTHVLQRTACVWLISRSHERNNYYSIQGITITSVTGEWFSISCLGRTLSALTIALCSNSYTQHRHECFIVVASKIMKEHLVTFE